MGIKTLITLDELSAVFPCSVLIPSEHGVSDSVYFTDRGVLKIFETASLSSIQEKRTLLLALSELPITRPISDIFFLREKPCALYETLPGKSPESAEKTHIIQIADFMNRFHAQSARRTSSNLRLFERERLQSLIAQTNYPVFQILFDSIDLELSNDGVIHGDLFLDNALFDNDALSGVLDFTEACEGDFLFDLAVVAASWCLDQTPDRSKIDLLLRYYDRNIYWEEFAPYMKYALLYYATTRYLNGRNYQSLLQKIRLVDTLQKGFA